MYPKMNLVRGVVSVLLYHKRKVAKGLAECLLARNFLKEAPDLDFSHTLYQFQRLTTRNERVQRNVLHLFLSFGKDEKVTNAQMAGAATDILDTLSFSDQPAIVYRHFDALHPHAHVVSPTIRPDGKPIRLLRADYYRLHSLARS